MRVRGDIFQMFGPKDQKAESSNTTYGKRYRIKSTIEVMARISAYPIGQPYRFLKRQHNVYSHAPSHRIASHRIASHRIASHRIASHRIGIAPMHGMLVS
jgi:hypothetical protein